MHESKTDNKPRADFNRAIKGRMAVNFLYFFAAEALSRHRYNSRRPAPSQARLPHRLSEGALHVAFQILLPFPLNN